MHYTAKGKNEATGSLFFVRHCPWRPAFQQKFPFGAALH